MNMEGNTDLDLTATLDRILRDLDVDWDTFPEAALQEARRYRQEIMPRLIEAIRSATAQAAAGNLPDSNLHFFATYLLTEFRAHEALPALLDAISLPGELPFDLYGDAITEDLPAMLVALVGEAPEMLDGLIANRELNEYVRGAVVETFLRFVRDGRMTRDYAIERLRFHLREALEHRDAQIGDLVVLALGHFAAQDALEEIREAYRLEIVDPQMIGRLADIERGIAAGEVHYQEALKNCWPSGIDDVVDHLRGWYAFSGGPEEHPTHAGKYPYEPEFDLDVDDLLQHPDTIVHTGPRVGRNDPCPCGSGKKFKKCCGRQPGASPI